MDSNEEQLYKSPLVVTFCSVRYIPMLLQWYMLYKGCNTENPLLIVALDQKTLDIVVELQRRDKRLYADLLLKSNTTSEPQDNNKDESTPKIKRTLWIERAVYLCGLLEQRISFIHTDIDAFWYEDVAKTLKDPRWAEADVIFSGNIWGVPVQSYEAWGFNLCCGLFCFRSTDRARSVARLWLQRTRECGDDQIAINRLLLDNAVQWLGTRGCGYVSLLDQQATTQATTDVSLSSSVSVNGSGSVCVTDTRAEEQCALAQQSIAVLPLRRYTRRNHERYGAVLFHPWLKHVPELQKVAQCAAWHRLPRDPHHTHLQFIHEELLRLQALFSSDNRDSK